MTSDFKPASSGFVSFAFGIIVGVAFIMFCLATVGNARAAVPQDLLDAKPTATLVNLARWEATQKEKQRRGRRTWTFHGDGRTVIVLESEPTPTTKVDWAFWIKDTPAK